MSVLRDLSTDARIIALANQTTQLLTVIHEVRTTATSLNTELHLAMVDEPDTAIDDLLAMGANHFRSVMENANTALNALTPIIANCRQAAPLLTRLADREDEIRGAVP